MEYKSPNDVLIFTANFTDELGGSSISSRTVTVESGLTKDSDSISGTDDILITVSGGTAGTTYRVTVQVTSAVSETFEKEFFVRVRKEHIG